MCAYMLQVETVKAQLCLSIFAVEALKKYLLLADKSDSGSAIAEAVDYLNNVRIALVTHCSSNTYMFVM